MNDTNPRQNGKCLRMQQSEATGQVGWGAAKEMREACERWLQENDPTWIASGSYSFGSIRPKKRAA